MLISQATYRSCHSLRNTNLHAAGNVFRNPVAARSKYPVISRHEKRVRFIQFVRLQVVYPRRVSRTIVHLYRSHVLVYLPALGETLMGFVWVLPLAVSDDV